MPWPLWRSSLTTSSVIIMAVTFQLERRGGAAGAPVRAASLSIGACCLLGATLCVTFQSSKRGVGHKIRLLSVSPQLAGPTSLGFYLKESQDILD